MHRLPTGKRTAYGALLATCAFLQGCKVGPHYQAPPPPTVSSYTPQPESNRTASSPGRAGTAQNFEPSAPIPEDW
jgi:hypothetical protein